MRASARRELELTRARESLVRSNLDAADAVPHYRYDRAQLIIAAGKRGYGKTTLIERYIQRREPRLFMVDVHNDFPAIPTSPTLLAAMADFQKYEGACWRRIVPGLGGMENLTEVGEVIFEAVNRYLRRALVVYNEITLWADAWSSDPLDNQIRQARRLGLKHLIDTQRFAEAPDIMRSEGTHLAVFHTSRWQDREILRRETDPQVAEIARSLDVGECVLVDL